MSFNLPGCARYGIHSIDHFALEVPELPQARRFLDAFGLRLEDVDGAINVRAAGSAHCWARILPGPCKRLAYLSLNCYPEELEPLRAQAIAAGAKAAVGPYVNAEGFWIYDPDGNLIQVKAGEKTSPDTKTANVATQVAAGVRGVSGRTSRLRTTPTRLSHVLMFTTCLNTALQFYEQALGLYLSDRSRDIVAFMHGRHGSDHHLIAFVQSKAKGWHHSAWDVAGVDDIGRGSEQMRDAGYREGWGIAQHTLGSNYFYYVRDPWGSFWEYSAHIDFVPAGTKWQSADYPPQDALYMWGPEMPAYFIENSEA
jgi:catechol 2,3-dioxygenase-like lactoylglutathione lyase family enzyme